jgi:uncharacterized RDD family membrane protein YckC
MENQISGRDKNNDKIVFNFEEFELSEDSFKPMTKGLGFHHDQKNQKRVKINAGLEMKVQNTTRKKMGKAQVHPLLNELSKENKETSSKVIPSGLEAFYGATPKAVETENIKVETFLEEKKTVKASIKENPLASNFSQFSAWLIDVLVVATFSAVTTALLILVSGLSFDTFIRLTPRNDIIVFSTIIYFIYYLLYFTVLELSATPGKTILNIKLVTLENRPVAMKNTFTRSFVSILSFVALFLPMIVDFQGRLSDTKVVKA